jgi:hypothetical protein
MRLLEIASAEEQIALWKLVSDSVWAALQLQQSQQGGAGPNAARATDATPKRLKGKRPKNAALKSVLKGYGRVGKLPTVPVPPKSSAKSPPSKGAAGSPPKPPENQQQPTASSTNGRPNPAAVKQPVVSTVKSVNANIGNRQPVDPNSQSQQLPSDQLPSPQITPQKNPPFSPKNLQKRGVLAQNQTKTDRDYLDTKQA